MKKLLVLLMALFTLAQVDALGKERYPHRNGQHRLNSPSSS